MSVSDHLKPGLSGKITAKIMTVDTANRRIEGGLKDFTMIQIAVWDVGPAFRWPIEGEVWSVRRDNGIWMLGGRYQEGVPTNDGTQLDVEAAPLETMSPGEVKLDGNVVIDASGRTFVAVDLTGIQNGWTLSWDATLGRFVAGP